MDQVRRGVTICLETHTLHDDATFLFNDRLICYQHMWEEHRVRESMLRVVDGTDGFTETMHPP